MSKNFYHGKSMCAIFRTFLDITDLNLNNRDCKFDDKHVLEPQKKDKKKVIRFFPHPPTCPKIAHQMCGRTCLPIV